LNCENDGAYFAGDVNIDGTITSKDAVINGSLNVTGDAVIGGDVTYKQSIAVYHIIRPDGGDKKNLMLFVSPAGALCVRDDNYSPVKFTTLYGGSQTITHRTDEIQGPVDSTLAEIGTFCETNGGIYTGYDKIAEADCICQVKQSTTLNPKIVGIITGENEFASHGDVLVKIVPGTYHLGDILCPDITGKARIATETELQYMMLHAIPRPKITSLDTKIEGTVACFLV
jgi:hypothetical protein